MPAPNVTAPDTRARIVRAALEWVDEAGLARISMAALAKRARLARATLYQHFTGREALVEAVLASELDTFYASIREHVESIADESERIAAGFGFAYAYLHEHRALQHVLSTRPELLLPYILGDTPQLQQGRTFFLEQIRTGGYPEGADVQGFADFIVRQLHSLLLTPLAPAEASEPASAVSGLGSANVAAGVHYAREFVLPAWARLLN